MNHRNFIRQLSSEDRRSLTERTNTSGLLRLSVLVLLFVVISVAILNQVIFWPILLLAQGLLIVSLFHLLHECVHDTPFRSRKINPIVGAICGFVLFLPAEWFRYFHRDHHRYTQIEGKDPELASAKPATKAQWLLHVTGLPVYVSHIKVIVRCTSGFLVNDAYIAKRHRSAVIRQARVMSLVYLFLLVFSAAFQSTALLLIWIVPLLIGQPFLRLYLLAEHTLCEYSEDMFLNTRTMLCNPAIRWFAWNMPYHTEHHVYPAVPFHQLPELHKQITDYLQHTNRSYSEFNKELYKTLE